MVDAFIFEDSIQEIGSQLRARVAQYCSEISLSASYCASRQQDLTGSSINLSKISTNWTSHSNDVTTGFSISSSLSQFDTLQISGELDLHSTDPVAKLGKSIVHLFQCISRIRTHSGRINLLDTGAIESTFALLEVLNADKRRGGLERGSKVKEAACHTLWSILEDFPEGQAACFR